MKKVRRIFLWIFVVLLSVSFVWFFAVTGTSVTSQQAVIGTVDNHRILNSRTSLYQYFYGRLYNYYSRSGQLNPGINQTILQTSFNEAVNHYLLLREADKARVYLSDEELIEGLRNIYGEEELRSLVNSPDPSARMQVETNTAIALRVDKFRKTLFFHVPATSKENSLYARAAEVKKQVFVGKLDLGKRVSARLNDEEALYDYFVLKQERYLTNTPGEASESTLAEDEVSGSGEDLSSRGSEGAASEAEVSEGSDLAEAAMLRAEFVKMRVRVREDFGIEQTSAYAEEEREQFQKELDVLLAKVETASAPRNVFEEGVQALGMILDVSDYFSYFDQEIPLIGSVTSTLTLPSGLIRELFTNPDETVFTDIDDIEDVVHVILVVDTKYPEGNEVETEDSFVAKRYAERVESDAGDRFRESYYNYVRSFAEIFYQGNPL